MNIVIDSSFVIDHLLGDDGAAARWHRVFEDGDIPFVTEVVVCEVRAGLRERDEPKLSSFLGPVEFVQPGVDAALQAGRWRYAAHRRGRHLSLADALIAAAAEALNAAVLTRNVRDFALTPVRIESY
ncbi:MAG: PIN domain-containing protein [Chloroflexota bacterium]